MHTDIRYDILNYTIGHLHKMYKNGELSLDNDFSRDFLWTTKEQVELIETILRNIPCPLIYLYQEETGRYKIIDGKQRLQTTFNFLDNKLKLNSSYYFPEFQDGYFNNIDKKRQYLFENYSFSCYVLRPPISTDLITDIFVLLNTKGTKASEHELRRSTYRGQAINLLRECADLSIFTELTKNQRGFSRNKDEELVLRYFALYIWLHIKKFDFESLNDLLNQTIRFIHEEKNIHEKLLNAFKKGITRASNILGHNFCYIRGKGKIPYDYLYFNKTLFETFCNLANLQHITNNQIILIHEEFLNKKRFMNSIKNNSVKNLKYRYKQIDLKK